MKSRWVPLVGALMLAGAGLAGAATVDDLHFEDPLWGDPMDAEALADRVVVVYYWAAD